MSKPEGIGTYYSLQRQREQDWDYAGGVESCDRVGVVETNANLTFSKPKDV